VRIARADRPDGSPARSATVRSSPPARVPAAASSGIISARTPHSAASRSNAQVPAETSIIWLIAADEGSLAMVPQRLKMNQSCSWMIVRTCCQTAG